VCSLVRLCAHSVLSFTMCLC